MPYSSFTISQIKEEFGMEILAMLKWMAIGSVK
jgi:hypothetical protein